MNRTRGSILAGISVLVCAVAAPASAQVAPTLPRDTLAGGRLAPEANVPRGVVAPTLPRDTLAGATLPATANVMRGQVSTMPSDSITGIRTIRGDSTAAASDSAHGAPTLHATTDSAAVKPTRTTNPRLHQPR